MFGKSRNESRDLGWKWRCIKLKNDSSEIILIHCESVLLNEARRCSSFSALFESPLDSNSYYYIVNRRDGKTTLLFLHSFWKNAGKRKQAQVTHLIIGPDQWANFYGPVWAEKNLQIDEFPRTKGLENHHFLCGNPILYVASDDRGVFYMLRNRAPCQASIL